MDILILSSNSRETGKLIKELKTNSFITINQIHLLRNDKEFTQLYESVNPKFVIINKNESWITHIERMITERKYDQIVMRELEEIFTRTVGVNQYCSFLKRPLDLYFKENGFNTIRSFYLSEKNEKLTDKIAVSSSKQILFLQKDQIVFCKANRQYTEIYLEDSKSVLSSRTLMAFENYLDDNFFLRVHRKYLINLSHVRKFDRNAEEVTMSDGNEIKIAHGMRTSFLESMGSTI